MKVSGFTFEGVDDAEYQETYAYQMDHQNPEQTIYNAYSYKPLSYLDQWKRSEGHKWGVSTLVKIMENEIIAKKKA